MDDLALLVPVVGLPIWSRRATAALAVLAVLEYARLTRLARPRGTAAGARHRLPAAALTASSGARAHYDRGKSAGDRHVAAQRNVFNLLLGCLHHCLHTRQTYAEATAFPTISSTPNARAA